MDTNNNENLEKEVTATDVANTEVVTDEVKNEETKEQSTVVETPVAVSTQEVKVEEPKKEEPKKKSKFLPIFMCIVGILCLAVGIFLTVTADDSEEPPVNETNNNNQNNNQNNNNNNNNNNNGAISVANIKDFINYNKFEMNGTIKMVGEGMTLEMTEFGKYDALNNVYYVESSAMGFTNYEYYDLNNKMVYSSSDKVEWEKYTDEEMAFPVFPGTIIGKVKTNEGVTDLGNGSYSLNMDPAELPDMDGYTGKIPTTATFDANGYLTELTLDLTSLMASEGVTEYVITYKFASVNTLDSVSIPDSVIFIAVESEW